MKWLPKFSASYVVIIISILIRIKQIYKSTNSTGMTVEDEQIIGTVCDVASWNLVTSLEIPEFQRIRKFADDDTARFDNILYGQSRLLSAFVYPDMIAVITSALHTYGKPATCHYFDCQRQALPNSSFASFVMPMSTIYCPRRHGAEFVSVGVGDNGTVPEPIPLTFRVYEKPVHELSVCVGPLYGDQSKWLDIIEYVEHYRLIGVNYFYFTMFSINSYDRRVIDDYERLGLAESTTYQLEYVHPKWQFHMLQTNECQHRSRMHSKWVINVDIDERFVYTGPGNLKIYLKSIPPFIGELSVSSNRVKKTHPIPPKLSNNTILIDELIFLKYNQTTEISWYNLKGIIRPELVYFLFYHWSFMQSEGVKVMSVPKRIAHLRHYRSTDPLALNSDWETNYNGTYRETRLEAKFEKLLEKAVLERDNIFYGQSRLLSAFVYPDMIAVITSAQHTYGKPATCHYYDCEREELPNSTFSSLVLPMTTIYCPRKYGAEFVSVKVDNDTLPEPIPLTFRVFGEPVHELSVCAGPLYGNQSKWLDIIECVEHYRLVGATYFYFTMFFINEYDRRVIDNYQRLGLAESITYQLEYENPKWQFHLIQANECHHRSRVHSKWVINVDIDERLVYTGPGNLRSYLRSIPPNIGELSFSLNRVKRTHPIPPKLSNETNLIDELIFLKYNQTTEISWYNLKGIIRPELVYFLFYHWSFMQSEDVKVMSVPKRIAHLRHYRWTDPLALNSDWEANYNGTYRETRLEAKFEKLLEKAVLERVRYVYDQRMIDCEEIPQFLFNWHPRHLQDCRFLNETS